MKHEKYNLCAFFDTRSLNIQYGILAPGLKGPYLYSGTFEILQLDAKILKLRDNGANITFQRQ